jgi:hypothetical protein
MCMICIYLGMGPYILEAETPVAEQWMVQFGAVDKTTHMKRMFELTTRMNALARIALGNVNVTATTALQASQAKCFAGGFVVTVWDLGFQWFCMNLGETDFVASWFQRSVFLSRFRAPGMSIRERV